METQEILNKTIGTKEANILKPAKVTIISISIKDKTNDGADMKVPLAELMCKHPSREELIAITKVKVIKNDKVSLVSTWVQLDDDKMISKSSALATLMSHLGVTSLAGLYGKEAEAVVQSDANAYLCLKAY